VISTGTCSQSNCCHSQGSSVDIAVNPAQGLERGNHIGRFDVPEIPGVPDFIDFGQEFA